MPLSHLVCYTQGFVGNVLYVCAYVRIRIVTILKFQTRYWYPGKYHFQYYWLEKVGRKNILNTDENNTNNSINDN